MRRHELPAMISRQPSLWKDRMNSSAPMAARVADLIPCYARMARTSTRILRRVASS